MMRLAILGDVHGNLLAFEAALAHVARQSPDAILLLGDIVVGAPDSRACWHLARSLGCPMLRGNHERYVGDWSGPDASPAWQSEQFGPLRFGVAELSEAERQEMRALPLTLCVDLPFHVAFVHASTRSDTDAVESHTPEEALAAMFPNASGGLFVRGHNHVGQTRLWRGGAIVTNGSVGLALDGHATAQYLLLDLDASGWRVHHQSVPYDVDATLQRFRASGYLREAGPVGRLYAREVATAAQHVVPFMRFWARWQREGGGPLDEAVERFLNQF